MQIDVREQIDEIETVWIPMADGRRLAARLFLPKTASTEPVPVVLEYIPYRRRDIMRAGDEAMHRWFAAHGYACARVDIAGSGDSDGSIDDEYVLREQDDGVEVIEWLAAQPWSTGSVGMIGISWGGFNGLQIAARRPPALRAVISVCSTVDRYGCDVHYSGGCLNEQNLEWGTFFLTIKGLPPDPATVGHDRWREMWRDRIDGATHPVADWLRHQRRDDFWRHGSVSEDLAAIEAPVLAVSGWLDGYRQTVFDLVEGLSAPCKGILGPWGHTYPHDGFPGPAIGFLQECKRWWDHWLKGVDTGVDTDPAMRMWLQEPTRPAADLAERDGRWICLPNWPPPPAIDGCTWTFGSGQLTAGAAAPGGVAAVCSPLATGRASGQWSAYTMGKIAPDLPMDQRQDDAGSLVYDSGPLDAAVHVVGRPVARLRVASDRPAGHVVVRLNDVHPDGTSERLSYGVLNLCHRNGHDTPTPLEPGTAYDVEVPMMGIAQTVPPGHRLRLAISTSYWPMIWPSPEPTTLTVHEAHSSLLVPSIDTPPMVREPLFAPAESAVAGSISSTRDGSVSVRHIEDLGAQSTTVVDWRDDGVYVIDDVGTEVSFSRLRTSSIAASDPLSARVDLEIRMSFRRDEWDVRIESDVSMSSDRDSFIVSGRLAAFDRGEVFAERRFEETIARDHL